jgi:hypothetical protein
MPQAAREKYKSALDKADAALNLQDAIARQQSREQPKQAKIELPKELAEIQRTLIAWELIGGIAGWCWFGACAASVYFL